MPTIDFDEVIKADLQDDQFAASYLNDALAEGTLPSFLIAVRRVVKARGGFTNVASACKVSREHLYTMLSENGNPTLYSLAEALEAVGLKLAILPTREEDKRA